MVQILETAKSNIITLDLNSKLLQSNIILINTELNSYTLGDFKTQLLYLQSILKPEDTRKNPIQIYIDTPGGEVRCGLGLYDMIERAKKKGYIIKTINIGEALSFGAILLMAGSPGYRESLPNCSVMLHELSGGEIGKLSTLDDYTKEAKKLQEKLNEIIKTHSEFNPDNMNRKDVWLTAEEALSYKLIDKIL